MKKFCLPVLLALTLAMPIYAQQRVNASLTASSTDCTTASSCLSTYITNSGGATFTISTNASGSTVQFEASADNQISWFSLSVTPSNSTTAVTSTTGTGVWQANVAGYSHVRMRVSTYGGTAVVVAIGIGNPAARGGSGAGNPFNAATPGAIGGTTPAAGTFTTLNSSTMSNFRIVGQSQFPATAAGVNAADADLGTGTGEIWVPSNVTSLTGTNIVLSKHHYLVFYGSGPITVAPIRVPDSNTDTSADSGIRCMDHATLQLAANSNTDFIADTNFATLSGSGNTFGTYRFTLLGCILDGNKANQTALATRGSGTISTVARSAGGVVTIVFSNTPSPAYQTGDTINVGSPAAMVTNDGFSFNGRYIVQSAGPTQVTFNQTARNTIATVAATGAVTGYAGASGVRIFGRNFRIEDNEIGNNVLDGMWTEGYTPSFVDLTSVLESSIRRNRFVNSGGDGWVFWGPQLTGSEDNRTLVHGQWGRELFQPLMDVNSNDYVNTSGGTRVVGAGTLFASNLQPSSAAGWGLLIDSGTGPSLITTSTFACLACVGIEVRSPGHNISGLIQNSSPALKINGGSGIFNLNVSANTGTLITLTSEVNTSSFIIDGDTTSNTTCFSTSPGNSDFVEARTVNGTVCNTFNVPGTTIGAGGWTQTVPVGANSTFAVLGLAQTWSAAQSFNSGTLLPSAAGGTDPGSAALPFGNLWLGTAATNNFKYQPSATTGARVRVIPDWGIAAATTQIEPFTIVLTSQYTNSTTGFTNVAGGNTMQFPVLANTTYTAECHLYYQAAATGGLNIEFTGPATPTNVAYGLDDPSTSTTFNSSVATAYGTSLGQVIGTAATNFDATVSFSLVNGANAGTVNLLAKSSAVAQLQIQAGSFCKIE